MARVLLLLVPNFFLTLSTPEESLVESIQTLTQKCDQSSNYVGILNAVHTSLELQVSYMLRKVTNSIMNTQKQNLFSEKVDGPGAAGVQHGVHALQRYPKQEQKQEQQSNSRQHCGGCLL